MLTYKIACTVLIGRPLVKQLLVYLTSTVPPVLLRGNSTDAYVSYKHFLRECYHMPDHSISIVGSLMKKILALSRRKFIFTVSSIIINFKDIRQNFTHSLCMSINSSWARSSSSG
jgi:hypothetical protein